MLLRITASSCRLAGALASRSGKFRQNPHRYIQGFARLASYTTWYQQYDYDSLNRLQRVHEYTGSTPTDWQQEYSYDRYGNRTIDRDDLKVNWLVTDQLGTGHDL